MLKKLKGIFSFLLIFSMIISPNNISTASGQQSDILIKKLSVANPNYFDGFTIAKDSSKQIKVSISPKNAVNKELKWKTSNKSVVSVSKNGLIKGQKGGKADITVTALDGSGIHIVIPITVGIPVKKIVPSKKNLSLIEGDKAKVTMTVQPSNATNKKFVLKSANEKIATVSSDGEITAVSAGKTSIYAISKDGNNRRATVIITVKETDVCQTLTDEDVIDGKITVSDKTLKNLIIKKSVGNAEITLDNVKIRGSLEMANGAEYTVYAENSEINNVVALEEESQEIKTLALDSEGPQNNVSPTFVADLGTLVVNVDARGNVTVVQENTSFIGTVTVNRKLDGSIELALDGFNGNLVVNTTSNADIAITTNSCNIAEATISGTSSGQKLSLKDETSGGSQSTINKINIETNAAVNVDIPAKELVIADTVESADVVINQPIESIVNNGAATELEINSDITSIVSSGDSFEMKVAAGSQVSGIETSGDNSIIEVALGSTINNIVSTGDDATIGGSGVINEVKVEGNNTVIENDDAFITVGNNVTGTMSNGEQLPGGLNVGLAPTLAPVSTPVSTPVPTQVPTSVPTHTPTQAPTQKPTQAPTQKPTQTPTETPPETGTVIKIDDPGKIMAGVNVQMRADMENISWSVYSKVDDPYGYASIEKDTGILHPVSDGTVRIVATSNLNDNVYGAVDVTIYAKKFIGYEPLEPVVIDTDMNISDVQELAKSDIMPTEVNLIYETGNGSETETLTVELFDYWFGFYEGDIPGTYLLTNFAFPPAGYEAPTELHVSVLVNINTAQTNTKKNVISVQSIDKVVISTDENIINFIDFYTKYLYVNEVVLNCEDGSVVNGNINGWYIDDALQFNGAVPDTYYVRVSIDIPEGYQFINVYEYPTSISFFYGASTSMMVEVEVQTAQTPVEYEEISIPDTTQPKFEEDTLIAVIDSVQFIGAPSEVNVGELIDFSQYLTIETASNLASDKLVNWRVDGYRSNMQDMYTGKTLFSYPGIFTISAISKIDPTKNASITVSAVSSKVIDHYETFTPIEISTDMGIVDFRSLYQNIKDILPTVIRATDNEGNTIQIPIEGWDLSNTSETSMVIQTRQSTPFGFNSAVSQSLTISFIVPQSDNRIRVTEATLVIPEYTIDEDQYAVSINSLFNAVFGDFFTARIGVIANLEGGGTEQLLCSIGSWGTTNGINDELFWGQADSTVTFQIGLCYPEGYTTDDKASEYADIMLEVPVHITVEQTPRNEKVWVSQRPPMTYNVGDNLDLSQLAVRVTDTSQPLDSFAFVGYDNFAEYGLQLKLLYGAYEIQLTDTTMLTADMNNLMLVVRDTRNGGYAIVGKLTVNSLEITIDAFETTTISNGAVNWLYFDTPQELFSTFPGYVTSVGDDPVDIPVASWNAVDGWFTNAAGSYTFEAIFADLPAGYVISPGTTATLEVVVAETLSIDSFVSEDIFVPVGADLDSIELPDKIGVTLSDGVTSYDWLGVTWNLSGVDTNNVGVYPVYGSLAPNDYENPDGLVPSTRIIVDLAYDAVAESISMKDLPDRLIYNIGDLFSTTGYAINVNYSNVSVIMESAGVDFSGFDSTTEGVKEITVTYSGKTTTFDVFVRDEDPNTYSVIFISDTEIAFTAYTSVTGSAISAGVYVPSVTGSAISAGLPEPPEKDSYYFDSWYTQPDGQGDRITGESIVFGNMAAYANWKDTELLFSNYVETDSLYLFYNLYYRGNCVNLVDADYDSAYIANGSFYFRVDNPEGIYEYEVWDTSGNCFLLTLDWGGAISISNSTSYSKCTLEGKDYYIYTLDLNLGAYTEFTSYFYGCPFELCVAEDGTIQVLIPCDLEPGDYNFMTNIGEAWYKTTLSLYPLAF